MNILFFADEELSKEEILITTRFYQLGDSVNLSILTMSDSRRHDRELKEAEIIVTNTTKLPKQMIGQSPNLLLIGSLVQAAHSVDLLAAESQGILVIDPQQQPDEAEIASKLQKLQIILSELERFIEGKPLSNLVKPIYTR